MVITGEATPTRLQTDPSCESVPGVGPGKDGAAVP